MGKSQWVDFESVLFCQSFIYFFLYCPHIPTYHTRIVLVNTLNSAWLLGLTTQKTATKTAFILKFITGSVINGGPCSLDSRSSVTHLRLLLLLLLLRFAIVCMELVECWGRGSRGDDGGVETNKQTHGLTACRSSMLFSFLRTVRRSAPGLADYTHAAEETLDGTSYMWWVTDENRPTPLMSRNLSSRRLNAELLVRC